MPYITREDGAHFVIPSYRDVLTARQASVLQKEINTLSQNYGEHITIQRKGVGQYEVAFSPDTGYLFGETVWHYFGRPSDLVYCEEVPNTLEVYLVIVKGGSVYLDGSFPKDSISEELVIFLTQQNNFEIYIYGDVPISEKPALGKFCFESGSVKSFKILDSSAFEKLPLIPEFKFQLVQQALTAQGIGVAPVMQMVTVLVGIAFVYVLYSFFSAPAGVSEVKVEPNPYQAYVDALRSPAPDAVVKAFLEKLKVMMTIPGWELEKVACKGQDIQAKMISLGSEVESLVDWANKNGMTVSMAGEGIILSTKIAVKERPKPREIYPTLDVMARFIDNLQKVYPGNHLKLTQPRTKANFIQYVVDITITDASPMMINLIGKQFASMPFALVSIELSVRGSQLSGNIKLDSYGT